MFPIVTRHSFIALKKFCTRKPANRTQVYLDKIWDSDSLNRMMLISNTSSLKQLTTWLIALNNDKKIQLINNYFTF